nr:hypothetical protein [Candidatus Dependentiae bacterium]
MKKYLLPLVFLSAPLVVGMEKTSFLTPSCASEDNISRENGISILDIPEVKFPLIGSLFKVMPMNEAAKAFKELSLISKASYSFFKQSPWQ